MKTETVSCYICSFFLLLLLSCNQLPTPNNQKIDTTTADQEELLKKVEDLRRENEELERKLKKNDPVEQIDVPEADNSILKILKASKKFDADFKPIVQISLQNTDNQTITIVLLTVDFSFASSEKSSNCSFQKSVRTKIPPGAIKSLTLEIPSGYDKKCSDHAKVSIQAITFVDGRTQNF
jgi:hypothetical protein